MSRPRRRSRLALTRAASDGRDTSLLDVVDNVLSKGVVLTGDLTLALADVNLIYARLSLLLCAADRVLPDRTRPRPGGRRARTARAERRA